MAVWLAVVGSAVVVGWRDIMAVELVQEEGVGVAGGIPETMGLQGIGQPTAPWGREDSVRGSHREESGQGALVRSP